MDDPRQNTYLLTPYFSDGGVDVGHDLRTICAAICRDPSPQHLAQLQRIFNYLQTCKPGAGGWITNAEVRQYLRWLGYVEQQTQMVDWAAAIMLHFDRDATEDLWDKLRSDPGALDIIAGLDDHPNDLARWNALRDYLMDQGLLE